jgi:hypothetical protein
MRKTRTNARKSQKRTKKSHPKAMLEVLENETT